VFVKVPRYKGEAVSLKSYPASVPMSPSKSPQKYFDQEEALFNM